MCVPCSPCVFVLFHMLLVMMCILIHHLNLYYFRWCWLWCVPYSPCLFVLFQMLLVMVCSLFNMSICIISNVVGYDVFLVHHVYLYYFTCCWLWCVPYSQCVFVLFHMLLVMMCSLFTMCICIISHVVGYEVFLVHHVYLYYLTCCWL